MPSASSVLSFAACLALASAHCQILAAVGEAGSATSVAFQVDPSIARNCTAINPCQQDATIIRDAEITANIVNECGRTELSGNIDIGENTENALAAGAVTKVKAGTRMTVTIHQVNADGAGPFNCDLVEAGNNGIISQNLTVENNVPGANGFSQAKAQDFNITVVMPDTFACTGSSAGNVCTVRCRNNAQAGPFGGCFPVQQTDVTPNVNSASNIKTIQQLDKVLAQVQQNQADFAAGVTANQNAGSANAVKNLANVQSLLANSIISKAAPTQTVAVALGGAAAATSAAGNGTGAAATTSAAGAAATTKAAKANKNGKNNGAAASTASDAAAAAASTTAAAAAKGNKNNSNNKRAMKFGLRDLE